MMLKLTRVRRGSHSDLLGLAWRGTQVFGARLVAQAASFLAAVLVARVLGPQGFGVYSLAAVAALLLAQVFGAGIDMAAVRVSGRYREGAPERARAALFAAGIAKAAAGLLVLALAFALAAVLANTMQQADLALGLRYAALAALGQAMLEWTLATLQAREQFGRMLAVALLSAALKLAPVALLAQAGTLTVANALAALVIAAYAAFGLGALASWRLWLMRRWPERGVWRELWGLSGWLSLATLLGTIASSLDVLAVGALLGAAAAGIYAAARNLTLPLAFAGSALMAVLLPQLSAMTDAAAVRRLVRVATLAASALTAAGVLLLLGLAPLLFHLVYGAKYADAIDLFRLLAVAYGLQVVTWPALAYMVVMGRPQIVAGLIGLVLCAMLVGYALAVPVFGMVGAAWVFLGGYMVQCAAYGWLIWRAHAKGAADG